MGTGEGRGDEWEGEEGRGKMGLQQVLLNENPCLLPLQWFETFSQLFGHHEDSYTGA